MVQVIDRTPSVGATLGNLLGTTLGGAAQGAGAGIQNSIQQFFEEKKANREREQMQKAFTDLNLPPQLGFLPPNISKELLREAHDEQKLSRLLNLLKGGKQGEEIVEGEEIEETPEGLSEEDILAVGAIDPHMARLLQSQRESQQKRSEKLEERSFKRNEPFLKKIDEQMLSQPQMDLAISQMEGALQSGDFGTFRNVIGDLTGLEFLKTASAQVVNAASKEFIMAGLSELTGRPNQWIEQQLAKALINPQYANQANYMILAGLKHLNELRKARGAIALQLEEDYTKKGKEVPRNFQKIVHKKLEPLVKKFEQDYKRELNQLSKSPTEGTVRMRDPAGNIRAVPQDQVQEAQKEGYKKA